jgi:DNA invertase Pin-like site-specific DNA recombinase
LLQGLGVGMTDKKQGRKIGYARVSTPEQHLDMQLIALEKAGCERVFHDHGISGKRFPRKGLTKTLNALSAGDVLVIHKLDRLGRDTLELLKLQHALTKRQIQLESLTQSLDISTASGKLTFTIFAALAEHESMINGERTKGGMAARKAVGIRLGRPQKLTSDNIATARKMQKDHGLSMAALARFFEVSHNTIKRALSDDR